MGIECLCGVPMADAPRPSPSMASPTRLASPPCRWDGSGAKDPESARESVASLSVLPDHVVEVFRTVFQDGVAVGDLMTVERSLARSHVTTVLDIRAFSTGIARRLFGMVFFPVPVAPGVRRQLRSARPAKVLEREHVLIQYVTVQFCTEVCARCHDER